MRVQKGTMQKKDAMGREEGVKERVELRRKKRGEGRGLYISPNP